MNKSLKRTLIILLLLVISAGIGLFADFLLTKYEKSRYPVEYSEYVEKYSLEYGVPVNMIYSTIKVESNFKSNAVSSAGAVGLMQILPTTFVWLQELTGENLDDGMLYDPETNIRYGSFLLSWLYRRYENWETVSAAYNAGIGRVDSWLDDSNYSDADGILKSIPFKETSAYVEKIKNAKEMYRKLYNI